MKKLGKLVISPDKVMKNEELLNLQGGYEHTGCVCYGGNSTLVIVGCDCNSGLSVGRVCGPGYTYYDCWHA
jgi:hypothetical protein